MLTENSNGYSAHNKKIQDVAPGVLATDLLNRGQLEDGTFNATLNNLTVSGTLTASALTADSTAPAITAKAGGGQDDTLALSKNLNIVTTVATSGDSVTLPSAAVGLRITVVNLGANPLAVFPYTSDSINDAAADASVTVQPEATVTFNCYTGVLWESDNESVDSFDYLYVAGLIRQGATGVITAFAGGGQASATALTKGLNNVTTVATAGDSVKLPVPEQGLYIVVKNSGATALDIFPTTGTSIDALAANLAVRISPSSTAIFFAKSTTVWESNIDASFTLSAPSTLKGQLQILAADSAGNTVTTITNASQAATRTYTIPDAGATTANFLMSEGAQTINGVQSFGNQNNYKTTSAMTALAGGAQAGTALVSELNIFTTVATAADSAQLPVIAVGRKVIVRNDAAKSMAVFGQTGDAIDGAAANASFALEPGQKVTFEGKVANNWVTKEGTSQGTISTVTQITSKTTGVTVNSTQGVITTVTSDVAGLASCTFTVTNNKCTANSNIALWFVDYAGTIVTNGVPLIVGADNRTATGFDIIYYNAHATNALNGVLKIGFKIIN